MAQQAAEETKNLQKSTSVRLIGAQNSGVRLLFVGNSITWHSPSADCGWSGDWGMAATGEENDYVHRVAALVQSVSSAPAVCICQAAAWERAYKTGSETYPLYREARDFEADIIVMRVIENCPTEDFDPAAYKAALDGLLNWLNKSGRAKVLLTTGFWPHVGNPAIEEYAAEKALPCVTLDDLGQQPAMRADGLFAHEGVAAHPGDLGMQTIAQRIFAALQPLLPTE